MGVENSSTGKQDFFYCTQALPAPTDYSYRTTPRKIGSVL